MSGILIFLPDYEGDDRNELVARGLGDLLDPSVTAIFTPISKGPTGRGGKLVTFYPGNAPREYQAAPIQTWIEAPPDGELKAGRYWLGYVTKAKPRPEDFGRADLIDGDAVVLCDDKVWVIPCCEYAPMRLALDPTTGDETKIVRDEHKLWVDWSNEIYCHFLSDGFQAAVAKDRIVHIHRGLRYAALTLSKNYRVNAVLVDLLQLVDEFKAFDIARVACGLSLVERAIDQKKSMESLSQPVG